MDILTLSRPLRSVTIMGLRIKEIREERGISQADLAEALDMSPVQVSRFETGARRTNTEFLEKVAAYFKVSISELFHRREVPVVGYIGAGAEFHAIDDNAMGDGIDTIPAPPGCAPNAVAVQVRGESMSPVYMDGDVLIYWERRYDVDSFLNRRCVIGLADGRILVKTLVRGAQSGLYTLMSFNSATIADVAVEWCAKIEWVQPR